MDINHSASVRRERSRFTKARGKCVKVQLKTSNDAIFAESLTKSNMATYYQARQIVWDHNQFVTNWEELDNYEVYLDRARVGVVRFSYNGDTCYLRDFQILPECQGKGIGSKCLDLVVKHALERQSTKLVLRVFSENPAIGLYEAKGFVRTNQVKGLIEMEHALSSNPHQ